MGQCFEELRTQRRLPLDLMGLVQSQLGIALLGLDRLEEAQPLLDKGHSLLQSVKGDYHILTRQAARAIIEIEREEPCGTARASQLRRR